MICDLDVIQVGHGEVCIAANSDRWKVYEGYIATVPVDCIAPRSGRRAEDTPLLLTGISAWLFRNVVAVVHDDRDLRELHEIREQNSGRSEHPAAKCHRRWCFAFGKDVVATRLV